MRLASLLKIAISEKQVAAVCGPREPKVRFADGSSLSIVRKRFGILRRLALTPRPLSHCCAGRGGDSALQVPLPLWERDLG